MITEKRHELILTELAKKDFLTLQELIDRTGCSASTVRRDLSKLQQRGKLSRVHGGATLDTSSKLEPNLIDKRSQNLREKQAIGKLTANLIHDNDCIFIDAGSTTLEMIPYITARDLTVVTNGLTHVEELLKQGIKTFIVGGHVKSTTLATIGGSALDTLRRYRFDKAFLGINGIDVNHGLTTPDEQEALVKEYAMRLSQQSYVLADHTKYHRRYFAHVATSDQLSIIASTQVAQLDCYEQLQQQYSIIGGAK